MFHVTASCIYFFMLNVPPTVNGRCSPKFYGGRASQPHQLQPRDRVSFRLRIEVCLLCCCCSTKIQRPSCCIVLASFQRYCRSRKASHHALCSLPGCVQSRLKKRSRMVSQNQKEFPSLIICRIQHAQSSNASYCS